MFIPQEILKSPYDNEVIWSQNSWVNYDGKHPAKNLKITHSWILEVNQGHVNQPVEDLT